MENSYENAITNKEHLAVFLRTLQQFDRYFCEAMIGGKDFTLKIEVRGNAGKLLHSRVYNDTFDRPKGVEKKDYA